MAHATRTVSVRVEYGGVEEAGERTAPMGTTVRVASILLPAQTFHESLTPSRSSTSSKSNARGPDMRQAGGGGRVERRERRRGQFEHGRRG